MPGDASTDRRVAVLDVHYPADGGARGAAVVCSDTSVASVLAEHLVLVDDVGPYEPGAFFRRELPVLVRLCSVAAPLDLVVIDAYVDLDPLGRPGLGLRLHHELGIPVIGLAKTPFRGATHAVEVTRGTARRPLYVTAAGLSVLDAAACVKEMEGPFRVPDAVRRVDQLARGHVDPARRTDRGE